MPLEGNTVDTVRGLGFTLTIPSLFLSVLSQTLSLFQDLMEQLEKQDRTIRKLKKQLKVYSKRIGEMGGKGGMIGEKKGLRICICFSLSAALQLRILTYLSVF